MPSYRAKTRLLSSLIALAIFVSGLVTAFHHHSVEAKEADHCSVCVIGQQARSGEDLSAAGAFSIDRDLICEEISLVSLGVPTTSLLSIGKLSQAPPVL